MQRHERALHGADPPGSTAVEPRSKHETLRKMEDTPTQSPPPLSLISLHFPKGREAYVLYPRTLPMDFDDTHLKKKKSHHFDL